MRLLLIVMLLSLAACKKEKRLPIPTQMQYNRFEITVGYNESKRLDLDGNGTLDVGFRTYHVGDPIMKMDKIQYCAVSMIESNFPMNAHDDVDIRRSGDKIQSANGRDYNWYQVSLAVLAQKNIVMVDPPYWTGTWKDVQHQFLPIQIMKDNKPYNGWIEISFDKVAEKLIVHRSGVSLVPGVDIRAGY